MHSFRTVCAPQFTARALLAATVSASAVLVRPASPTSPASPASPATRSTAFALFTLDPRHSLRPLIFQNRLYSTDAKPSMAERRPQGTTAQRRPQKTPAIPAPSASVVVISPTNEVLLLHRVQTAGSFSSAHVFPGGNLSRFHEGELVPYVDSPARHVDGEAYRLAAIRETFEESGVLLAKRADGTNLRSLLQLHPEDIDRGRLAVANEQVRFEDWLGQVGGVPDLENLIPFTRWLTPPHMARRYTTQMYLYMMPLADQDSPPFYMPTADNTEVMSAEFAPAAVWIERAQRNEIILFPPQIYLLSLLAPFLASTPGLIDQETLSTERRRLAELVRDGRAPDEDARSFVPWADRVISPQMAGRIRTADGEDRTVMVLDSPGPELRGKRGGDSYRAIVLSNIPPGPPRDVEVWRRSEVLQLLRKNEKL